MCQHELSSTACGLLKVAGFTFAMFCCGCL